MKNISSSADRLFESLKKETRYCILECAVFIEEKASDTLGKLLEIDWKKSDSLGYGSASLGFDNKIRLIQDIKGVKPKSRTQFQSFMAIRNKFVHIAEIDSFDGYFKLIKSSNQRKNELKKWFPSLKWELEDVEGLYKFAYFLLTLDLFQVLFDIDIKHAYETGQKDGRKEAQEIFIENVRTHLQKSKEGKKVLDETFEKISNKMTS